MRRWIFVVLLLASGGAVALRGQNPPTLESSSPPPGISVTITSPLGRTGVPGTVRIVARIAFPPETTIKPVRFFVNDTLYGVDTDGPPYAVEWADDNPFEPCVIAVEVENMAGHVARDAVTLEPFEVQDKTEVFSVLLDAMVRDSKGRFVSNLDPRAFTLTEDGILQDPDLAGMESVPATFALLVDSSQSMARRFAFVRAAAGRLVSFLRPVDRVIVAPFARELLPLTGPTNDRDTVVGAIGAISAGGGTAIFDNLRAMADRLGIIEGRHDIILITDGYDENSTSTFNDAVEAIKRSQSTVYAVAIGGVAGISLKGERELKQLALETGGRAFFPPRIEDLPAVYEQLALEAQNRYMLSFTPKNQKQDGGWRTVSLTAGSPDYTVTMKDGYFAPMAPPIKPTIEFTVIDAGDRFLDVTRDDLVVLEDGIEQQIDTFQEAADPIQMVLTLDQSGSMRRSVDAVKAAASDFVRALRPGDPLAVITFADKARFAHDLATTREWSLDAIAHYEARGGTALYDALHDSIMRLKSVKGRRAVVVLTDGRDENDPGTAPGSVHTLHEVLGKAKEVDALIFPIGLGPNVDRPVLEQLAEISGGQAYFPSDVTELSQEYQGILENLRRRYVLGYTSSNPDRNGAWRRVDITLRTSGVQVRSRGGYFAPEK